MLVQKLEWLAQSFYYSVSFSSIIICSIGKLKKAVSRKQEKEIVIGLKKLPGLINEALLQETQIKKLASQTLKNKSSALFLGRGTMHAIAMEGALKLKEISYIHAEAYPAGELNMVQLH
jgi:glucosamine--fructose-6-phosphate aminotransferase (isomerizing)